MPCKPRAKIVDLIQGVKEEAPAEKGGKSKGKSKIKKGKGKGKGGRGGRGRERVSKAQAEEGKTLPDSPKRKDREVVKGAIMEKLKKMRGAMARQAAAVEAPEELPVEEDQ